MNNIIAKIMLSFLHEFELSKSNLLDIDLSMKALILKLQAHLETHKHEEHLLVHLVLSVVLNLKKFCF